MNSTSRVVLALFAFFLGSLVAAVFFYEVTPVMYPLRYSSDHAAIAEVLPMPPPVSHVSTPSPVRALYMSACLASDRALRAQLVELVNRTELNAIVIDIKDYSGFISFPSSNALFAESVSKDCVVEDMSTFIESLHRDGIYVIGRITVFQDPVMANRHRELAVKRDSDREKIWTDRKGISYLDPGARGAWDYIVALAREAHGIGFDEINFDYIRFPSDGNMNDIYFPESGVFITEDPEGGKAAVLREFFAYLHRALKSDNLTLSADLFGMTTTNTDDLGIGQVLEDALVNFDYVAPMVYPSHYPSGFMGFLNPAAKPYEVVKFSMDEALRRASTTPWKLRPWLQDFNLGAIYTSEMVRSEKQALYDIGLGSWMLWNAANRYSAAALDPL